MNPTRKALVRIAAALGASDRDRLRAALEDAAAACSTREVEEALLQSYLFVGYPRALQAFKLWREIAHGEDPPAADESGEHSWEERGARVFRQVYGALDEKVRSNAAALHPDLARWMVIEGYGKVLGREGLDLVTRELCIIAMLATQDAQPQLYSHLRGALHVGASEADVEEALETALINEPESRATHARDAWRTVCSRRGG